MRRIFLICVLSIAINIISPAAWAGSPTTEELLKEIQDLKARVAELEKKSRDQEIRTLEVEKVAHGAKREFREFIKLKPGEGVEIEAAGLVIGADGTFVAQGTPNANNAGDGEDSIFDGSWSTDIEIEKSFDDWGLAFVHLEGGQGNTIEGELSVFSNVNKDECDTGATIEVSELWYEHYLFNNQLVVTAGKLDPTVYMDQNEYANDETTQFLGRIFRNAPTIEWPAGNNAGLRLYASFEPIDFFEFEFGYLEGDGDWERIFDHNVYMAQVNFKPTKLFKDINSEQWDGNYRFYFWVNDRDHEKLTQEEVASEENKEVNFGLGLSYDQMITDVFGIFGRFGWQRPGILPAGSTMATVTDSPTLDWTWSVGAQMTGKYWMRESDVLAFAVGQVFPSTEWKKASDNNFGRGEGHIEVYYRLQLNECLALSPDIQMIWNPYGVSKSSQGDNDTIFVYGGRAQIDF